MWATLLNHPSVTLSVLGSDAKDRGHVGHEVTLEQDQPKEISDALVEHIKGITAAGRFTIVVTKEKPKPRPAWPVPDRA